MAAGEDTQPSVETDAPSLAARLRVSMRPVLIGLTAALIALALVIAQTIIAQREARVRATNESETLLALQSVLQIVLEAESSQRGYVLTADRDYLNPYLSAKARLTPALDSLRLVANRAADGETASHVNWIAGLADAKFAEMDRTIALTRTGFQTQAQMIVDTDIGQQQMDAIRAAIASEIGRKIELRRSAFVSADSFERRLVPLIAVLGAAIVALVIAGFRTERRRAEAAAAAEQADALREANDRVELLARELNHRVKNLFSVILAIVTLSARKQAPVPEVIESIRARIHALSLAHSSTQGGGDPAGLQIATVIANTMQPYCDEDGRRVRIGGPRLALPAGMISPIGMIIHELATNAVKYGALSADGGRVEIRWQIVDAEDGQQVELLWVETDGPALSIPDSGPESLGFGARMTGIAAQQLGGTLRRDWPASGAVAVLSFPVPAS